MHFKRLFVTTVFAFFTLLCMHATAGGKLLATGGVTQVEGSGGGGLVPWATISSYAEKGEIGGTAFITHVTTGDYQLNSVGATLSINNRIELSLARQNFDLGTTGIALGLGDGVLRQHIVGAKVRLIGDIIYDALPQISLGVQHKKNLEYDVPESVGAEDDTGTDIYLSVGKVFLASVVGRNLFLNGTFRATKANELGLLGFGGDKNDSYEIQTEVSAVLFLDRRTILGLEYRQKPDNLGFAKENDWGDIFIAYVPTKRISFVGAYTFLDSIAGLDNQDGFYLSMQAAF